MSDYEFEAKSISNDKIAGTVNVKKGKNFSISNIAPWAAIFISALSLGLTIQQAKETRNHNIKSVTPYLKISRFGITKSNMGIEIENNGVGPGIVEDFIIKYNGISIDSFNKFREVILKDIPELTGDLIYTEMNNGYFYPAGAKVQLLQASEKISADTRRKFAEIISKNTEVFVKYCSVYNRCSNACLIKLKSECKRG